MSANEVAWPMGMTDQDPLVDAGFAERDLRVYTSRQILDDRERFLAKRTLPGRPPGPPHPLSTPRSRLVVG
jgi:hypothetical protein